MLPVINKTGEIQEAKESSYSISSDIATFEGKDDNAKTDCEYDYIKCEYEY